MTFGTVTSMMPKPAISKFHEIYVLLDGIIELATCPDDDENIQTQGRMAILVKEKLKKLED